MSGTVKTTKEIRRVIALRAAGYTIAAISDKTGISAATIKRHLQKHGIERGTVSTEAVEAATKELLQDAGFIDGLKTQIAAAVVDDLVHTRQLREAASILLEELMTDSTTPPHHKTRSLAALSTSLRLTQEVQRKALGADKVEREQEALPELPISDLTNEEIAELRRTKSGTPSMDDEDESDELEDFDVTA